MALLEAEELLRRENARPCTQQVFVNPVHQSSPLRAAELRMLLSNDRDSHSIPEVPTDQIAGSCGSTADSAMFRSQQLAPARWPPPECAAAETR